MSEELRPCPFCGNKPVVEGNLVACNNLNCPTHDNYWTDPMIFTCDQWNTRPIEDALNARIAELEGIVKADNLRLINAGLSAGLYSGCDTAEMMAEEILASRARIAELEAAQRWIPVSERLPEVGKVVHVIDMNDAGGHLCNLYETAMLVEVSGNKRFGFIGHSGWDTSDVTHWMYAMPLPTPPEVQE